MTRRGRITCVTNFSHDKPANIVSVKKIVSSALFQRKNLIFGAKIFRSSRFYRIFFQNFQKNKNALASRKAGYDFRSLKRSGILTLVWMRNDAMIPRQFLMRSVTFMTIKRANWLLWLRMINY